LVLAEEAGFKPRFKTGFYRQFTFCIN